MKGAVLPVRGFKAIIVVILLSAAACAAPDRPIPAGTYYPEFGDERIVVVPSMIYFHVNVDKQKPDIIGSREYPYELSPDGKIYFVVSSNSRFGLRLAMNYEWLWRDGRIGKVDLETRKTIWFALRE